MDKLKQSLNRLLFPHIALVVLLVPVSTALLFYTFMEDALVPEEDKMEQLRRLDKSVTSKGTAAALIVGILSTLVLGFGMSCCMVWADKYFVLGVITGIVGLIGAGLAYPVYSRITKNERERLAPEILKLTEELMK